MTTPAARIRSGKPTDLEVLSSLEHTYFAAVPGQPHSGYLFDDRKTAMLQLQEEIGAALRFWTVVAEVDGEVVGFATAVPSQFPGGAGDEAKTMLLSYLAVDPRFRRRGIGGDLVAEIERRSLAARQNLIVAHVPAVENGVYTGSGWTLYPKGRGLAWLQFGERIGADLPDPLLGFPLMAAKALRPRGIRRIWDFDVVHDAPGYDAIAELVRIIDAGEIDVLDLDEDTAWMVDRSRRGIGPKPPLASR